MTITIKNKEFTSAIPLANILNVMTKVEMLKICDLAEAGKKLPSKKQLRMMAALNAFMGKD